MKRTEMLIVIALLLLEITAFHSVRSDVQWIKVSDSVVSTVALYDIDSDGKPEIVTPSFILDDNGILQIPLSQLIKYDYDGDGILDLILYRPSEGQLIVFINSVSYVYSIPINSEIEVYSNGLKIGNKLYSHKTELAIPSDAKSVAPLYYDGALRAVYIDTTGNLMYYDGGTKRLIYPLTESYTIIDATAVGSKIYVVLATPLRSNVLISYNVNTGESSIRIIGSNITWERFILSNLVYQIGSNTYVYDLDSGNISLLDAMTSRIIYPIMNPNSFAIVSHDSIKIYINGMSSPSIYSTPSVSEVYSVDAGGDMIVIATSDGVYVYGKDVPTLNISAPSVAFVNEPIPVNITGSFDKAYITVDDKRYEFYSNPVSIAISKPGTHNIVATACKNMICTSKTVQILVKAKTMKINIVAPKTVEPYSQLNVTIVVTDANTGRPVEATCRVRVSDSESYYTATGGKVNIMVTALPKGVEIPIVAECSATGYINSSSSMSITISSYYYMAELIYVGGGTFVINAYNKYTSEPFNGTIEASLDGKAVPIVGNRVTVPPGNHTLDITLKRNDIVVGKYRWSVTYYPDISQVPPNQQVIIGDRVREVTETITTTKIATITIPVTVETVNPLILAGMFIFGVGLGLAILFLQAQRQKRHTGK